MKSWTYLWIVWLLLCGVDTANAQTAPPLSSDGSPASSAKLIVATREYQVNSENLLRMQEDEIAKTTQKLGQLRQLVADGLVARNELTEAEESVAALRAAFEATQRKIGDAEQMIAEIQSEEIRKTQSAATAALINKERSLVRPTVLRYNGAANWSLGYLAGIQNFFSTTFGRSLPVNTVGQSATHNRLGWDHRNAVDVGLHPDSAEGKILISFLQTQDIPFLAFRGPIPGVSTGAHIHIGRPSHRLS